MDYIGYNMLITLLLNALWCVGLNRSSQIEWQPNVPNTITKKNLKPSMIDLTYSQILWPLQYYAIKTFGIKWSKPLITCPTCMASFHGTIWWVSFNYDSLSIASSYQYVVYIICLSGINSLLSKQFD